MARCEGIGSDMAGMLPEGLWLARPQRHKGRTRIMRPMDLIVPFAAPGSEAAQAVLQGLALPTLRRLLARLGPPTREMGDEWSLSTPHDRAWARAMGWGELPDGLVPTAAWLARQSGLAQANKPVGEQAADPAGWALLTPAHWRLGTEQVSLTDPASLNLNDTESRAFFEAIRGLFESEGFAMHWLGPSTWLCQHAQLVGLPTASLDRVIGRNVDRWLGADKRARLVRRLQNEVQMLLHEHPLNQAREALGAWAVNSVWLSGCGELPGGNACVPAGVSRDKLGEIPKDAVGAHVQVFDGLRGPALAEDAPAWGLAYETLDGGALAAWYEQAERSGQGSLTLCGERGSLRWAWQAESTSARFLRWTGLARPTPLAALLQDL